MQPIWVVRGGERPVDGLVPEILRCEGYPWLETCAAAAVTDVSPEVKLIVVTGEAMTQAQAYVLARAVAAGTPLIALSPQPALSAEFEVTVGPPSASTHLVVDGLPAWPHGPLPLLCPGGPASVVLGGEALARLEIAGQPVGPGVAAARLGAGRAWLMGIDLATAIATLRHGSGSVDQLPDGRMGPLAGPRHIYSYSELSDQLPRDYPVADLLGDLVRLLVEAALAGQAIPRIWHFPAAAPALWFVKSDGCGEPGLETLIDVCDVVGAKVSFYRPPVSRYPGAMLRDYATRGHGFSIEADINDLTQSSVVINGRSERHSRPLIELNGHWLPHIRARLESQRDALTADLGVASDTLCIHSCQWTGAPMAELVLSLGWHTPTHFISHDPRMRRGARFGPYMIASALPMRYFDHTAGVLELWHMPAQWDESQMLGEYESLIQSPAIDWPGWQVVLPAYRGFYQALAPDRARGIVGLSVVAYGAELARAAEAAATCWHGVQICNFHPLYVGGPQDHPRASRQALELGLAGAREAGCRFENLENWSRFFRARAAVKMAAWWEDSQAAYLTLAAPLEVRELTLLLPPSVTDVHLTGSGDRLPTSTRTLEGRLQQALILDLRAGQQLTLRLAHAPAKQ